MARDQFIAAARGDMPADLVLRDARLANVFSGEIETTDIVIHGDRIAGLGPGYVGREEIRLNGAYVAPGLIDAHVHIESSLCLPAEFARTVVPRGVTTVVADPHEIANVAGAAGVRFMAMASGGLPLRVVLMAPSCVPATEMATTGAALTAHDLKALLEEGVVHGLAEVMNFPGVIARDPSVAVKLEHFQGHPIDGHAPGVVAKALNAYIASGIGSDHECVSIEEAKEKLSRGMYVLIRDATNARNLDALLPLVTPTNSRRFCLCTDDRTPVDLLEEGSVDAMVRRAIAFGVEPVTAIRMATLNPAEWFGLHDRGAVAPGRLADFFIFDDLAKPTARIVYVGGRRFDRLDPGLARKVDIPPALARSVRWAEVDFTIPARPGRIRVIGSVPDQITTTSLLETPTVEKGNAVADPQRDLLKIAVIERHRGSGKVGLGFIRGFGLRCGAIAGTFVHDHHNLAVIGCDDGSMQAAARAVAQMQGGLAVVEGGKVLAGLPLPVAGLMSDQDIQFAAVAYTGLLDAARKLGCPLRDPFGAMSFMALEVIPSLKLTDQGLVDVDAFRQVDLFV